MKKLILAIFFLFSVATLTLAQSQGCRIVLGVIPPEVCAGNTYNVTFVTTGPCFGSGLYQVQISGPGFPPFNFDTVTTGPTSTATTIQLRVPLTSDSGLYGLRVRHASGIVSDVKLFKVLNRDFSPAPIPTIQQTSPIQVRYCPDDIVNFNISSLVNGSDSPTYQWFVNGRPGIGEIAADFGYLRGLGRTDTIPDTISLCVTKDVKCSEFAFGCSQTIILRYFSRPVINIELDSLSSGCELEVNKFVATVTNGGINPFITWYVNGIPRDSAVNYFEFTWQPSDSNIYQYVITARVRSNECDFRAISNGVAIKACGRIILENPVRTPLCANDTVSVYYSTINTFVTGNQFLVQLSNASGSFASPVVVGSITATDSGRIVIQIPPTTPAGTNYLLRIISTNPQDTSNLSNPLEVRPIPGLPTTFDSTRCGPGFVTLFASGAGVGQTYRWYTSPTGGLPLTDDSNVLVTGGVFRVFVSENTIFYVALVSEFGCENPNRAPVNAIVNELQPLAAGPDQTFCPNSGLNLLLGFSPSGGVWTSDPSLPIIQANSAVDINSSVLPGNYTLTYTVTFGNGCENSDSKIVTVISNPTVNAGPDLNACSGDGTLQLNGIPSGGIWFGPNVTLGGLVQLGAAIVGTNTYIYELNQNGCFGRDSLQITVSQSPEFTIIDPVNPTSCGGTDGSATINLITPTSNVDISWNTTPVQTTLIATNLGAGVYTATVTNNANGCANQQSIGLSDPTAVVPSITLNPTYCTSDPDDELFATPLGGTNRTFTGSGIVNGNFFSPTTAGEGPTTVVFTYTDVNGCIGAITANTFVNPGPVVNPGRDTAVCENAGIFTLGEYQPLNGTWSGNGVVQPDLFNPGLSNVQFGPNTLTLTATQGTCTASATKIVTVNPVPTPVISADQDLDVCQGTCVTIRAEIQAGIILASYQWFRNDTLVIGSNGSTIQACLGGVYRVVVTTASNCSAGSSNTLTLTVRPAPTAQIVSPTQLQVESCRNEGVLLTANTTPTNLTYQWNLLGNPIPNATSSTFVGTVSGVYTVTTGLAGCFATSAAVELILVDNPPALVTPEGPITLCYPINTVPPTVTLQVNQEGETGLSYNWFRNGVATGNTSRTLLVSTSGDYSVQVAQPGSFGPPVNSLSDNTDFMIRQVTLGCTGTGTGCPQVCNQVIGEDGLEANWTDGRVTITAKDFNGNPVAPIFRPNSGPGAFRLNSGGLGVLSPTAPETNNEARWEIAFRNNRGESVRLDFGTCGTITDATVRFSRIYVEGNLRERGNWAAYSATDQLIASGQFAATEPLGQNGPGFLDLQISTASPFRYLEFSALANVRDQASPACSTLSNVVEVRINQESEIQVGPALDLCKTASPVNLLASPDGGVWSGPGVSETNPGQYIFTPSASLGNLATLTYTYFDTISGCTSNVEKQVFLYNSPSVSDVVITDATACDAADGSVNVTVVGNPNSFSYNWTGPLPFTGNGTPAISNLQVGIYTVRIINNTTGCDTTFTIPVTSPESGSVQIILNPEPPYCSNGQPPFAAISAIPNRPGQVFSGEAVIQTGGGALFVPGTIVNGGNTVINYVATIAPGCTVIASRTVFVTPSPVVDAGPDLTACQDDPSLVLEDFTPFGGTWESNRGGIRQLTDSTLEFAPSDTGIYILTYTIEGQCIGFDSRIIRVIAQPDISLTSTNTLGCGQRGGSATVSITPTGNYKIRWETFPAGGEPLDTTTTISNLLAGTYRVEVTNRLTGCERFGFVSVEDPDSLLADTSISILTANGQPIQSGYCRSEAAIQLVGQPAGGVFVPGSTFDPATAQSGANNIIYTVTDANGCGGSRTITINVNDSTLIDVGQPITACLGSDPFNIPISPPGAVLTTLTGQPFPTLFNPGTQGTFPYRLVFTNANGCTSVGVNSIIVSPAPVAAIQSEGSNVLCGGTCKTLSANTGNGLTYQWFRNNQLISGATNAELEVCEEGDFAVDVTFAGCTSRSNIINISVIEFVADAGPDITNGICANSNPVNLAGANVPPTGASVNWSGNGITNPGLGTFDPSGLAGCQTITYNVAFGPNDACISSDVRQVCIDSLPAYSITSDSASSCNSNDGGASVNIVNPSDYSIIWSQNGNQVGVGTSISNVAPGVYVVIVTNQSTGCSSVRQAIINSPNDLNPTILGVPSSSVCETAPCFNLTGTNPPNGIFSSTRGGISIGTSQYCPNLVAPGVDTISYSVNVNGCLGTVFTTLTIDPSIPVNAGLDSTSCLGDTINLIAINPSAGVIWTGQGVSGNTFVSTGLSGDITVTATVTSGACTSSDSRIITVRPLPLFVVNSTPVSACGGEDGTATVVIANPNSFNYAWTPNVSGSTVALNLKAGTYFVRVTETTTGCARTDAIGVTEPSQNPITFNLPTEACFNGTNIVLGDINPSLVRSGFSGVGLVGDTLNLNVPPVGVRTITYQATDTNGCILVGSRTIDIQAPPGLPSLAALTLCKDNGNILLSDTGSWTSSINSLIIGRTLNINLAPVNVPFQVAVTVTNTAGCTNSGTRSITVNDTLPSRIYGSFGGQIVTSGTIRICRGSEALLVAPSATGSNFNYQWQIVVGGVPTNVGTNNDTLRTVVPGTYQCLITLGPCAKTSNFISIEEVPSPEFTIASSLAFCSDNGLFQIPFTVTRGTPNFLSPGYVSQGGVVTVGNVPLGANIIQFVVSEGNCSDTTNVTLNNNQAIVPTLSVTGNTSICDDGSITLITQPRDNDANTYVWTQNQVIVPGANADSLTINQAGTYRVQLAINGQCERTSTDSLVLRVITPPVVNAGADATVCGNQPAFDLVAVEPNDGIWISPIPNLVIGSRVFPNVAPAGVYSIIYNKTIEGCSKNDSLTLTINRVPNPAVLFESTGDTCQGDSIRLAVSPFPGDVVTWFRNNLLIPGATDFEYYANENGRYFARIVSDQGCRDSSSNNAVNMNFRQIPAPNATGAELCKNGASVQLLGTPIGAGVWEGPGVNSTGVFNPVADDVPAEGPVEVVYVIRQNGCVRTDTATIVINPAPNIVVEPLNQITEIRVPVKIAVSGAASYVWSPAAGLDNATSNNPTVTIAETARYLVTGTTDKGCTDTASALIIVDQEFKVFNGFSPNGDDINGEFEIKNIQKYPKAKVFIYNRWGNKVFESEPGYPNKWDGKYNGTPVPPGAYYYVIELDADLKPIQGSMTILR